MTCEKAEEYLSAYLDDILAPQLRGEVDAHLESCDHCRETLEDYRRFDRLIAAQQRIEPSAELHDRIFDSPAFAAILAEDEQDEHAHERVRTPRLRRLAGAGPGWARGALSAAAVAALVFGSALLIKQGLLHSGTPSARTTQLVAGSGDVQPLAHGARVVYLRDGSLWSAPESGPGLADRLTPQHIVVGAWSVAPDGSQVAYVDTATGLIHVVRADDQDDVATASISAVGSRAALVWSPDGQRIAYVASVPGGSPALHLMNANGANDLAVSIPGDAAFSAPVWSPDSLNLAFAADAAGSHGVYVYNVVTKGDSRLLAPADASDSAAFAVPGSVRWLPDMTQPTVTWAATGDAGATLSGVFAQSVLAGSSPRLLTTDGARYSAADFSTARGGEWLVSSLGDTPRLELIQAQSGARQSLASGTAYAHIAWAPAGAQAVAALVSANGRLALWSEPIGLASLPDVGLVHGGAVWAPDGQAVAAPLDGGAVIVRVSAGAAGKATVISGLVAPRALAFAPDGAALAIAMPGQVAVVGDASAAPKVLGGGAAQGVLAWTSAG